jgi:AcrR family transcriptional regulator
MPRTKTQSDQEVLEAALALIHAQGPDALTFQSLAKACGLSASTLVQRFGSKPQMVRAALLHAWDGLDAQTARLAAEAPLTPEGAIQLLMGLSHYGEIEAYADALLVLREDLRDPVLRARGAAWKAVLIAALDARFADARPAPRGVGLLLASQWQGSLIWWSFDPQGPVEGFVEDSLRRLVEALLA